MSRDYSKTLGRVIGVYGQRVDVICEEKIVRAVVRGRLKHVDAGMSLIAVGDFVELSRRPRGASMIERIIPRMAVISRPSVRNEEVTQIIVANVDRMVIVSSLKEPPFSAGLVDRFLVVAFKEKIHPVIIINKIDLADVAAVSNERDAWGKISGEVICASAHTGEGLELVKKILEKGTSVVVGHSGVGKSSLLNRINPSLNLKTGMISAASRRGKHITSRANLFRISPDGWVADTPGLRDLGLVGVNRKNLHRYFPEFAACESDCHFDDCLHVNEPKCGVKLALQNHQASSGGIAEFRYRNYLRIYESLDG